jgi:hypothetical protein
MGSDMHHELALDVFDLHLLGVLHGRSLLFVWLLQ